jgi:hypothetical protein
MRRGIIVTAVVTGALAGIGPAPASAYSEPNCSSFSSFDPGTAGYGYRKCGIPDLDQKRKAATGFAGLPKSGKMWCVPTAAMDLFAYMADRGIKVGPGSRNWRGAGTNYRVMTRRLRRMGVLMNTDPDGGTGSGAVPGIAKWIKETGGPGAVVVDLIAPSVRYGYVGIHEPALRGMGGSLVVALYGRYFEEAPGFWRRYGGHAMALVGGQGNLFANEAILSVRDPATPDYDSQQLEYEIRTLVFQNQTAFYAGKNGGYAVHTLGRLSGSTKPYPKDTSKSAAVYLDGTIAISPQIVAAVTAANSSAAGSPRLSVLPAFDVDNGRPRARNFRTAMGRTPSEIVAAPASTKIDYLVPGSDQVWELDTATGQTTALGSPVAGARQIAVGGPARTVYVAGEGQLKALARDGRELGSRALDGRLDALEVDSEGRVIGATSTGRLLSFDSALQSVRETRLNLPAGSGRVNLALGPSGGLVARRDGGRLFVRGRLRGLAAAAGTRFEIGSPRLGRLRGTRPARGLTLTDAGHVLVSENGRLAEYTLAGQPVVGSAFTGRRAGAVLSASRSFSNFDPATAPSLDQLDDAETDRSPLDF